MLNEIPVQKYSPERIDMDPLIGLNIEQDIFSEEKSLKFEKNLDRGPIDNSLIAEPFRGESWDSILKVN